jgi:hypothetical protein
VATLLHWYDHHVLSAGKAPLFWLFLGFLGGFLFIRLSVRMIRAQVRWWPGNITPGSYHLHHVVFGTVFMVGAGIAAFAIDEPHHPWVDVVAVIFGVGAALVLDEFALILHLDDVYWSEAGRVSVEAVFLAGAVIGLFLLGFVPLGAREYENEGLRWAFVAHFAWSLVVAAVTMLKGKVLLGSIAIFVPLVGTITAVLAARPHSPWARWFYRSRPAVLARAQKREQLRDRVVARLIDTVAGSHVSAPKVPAPPSDVDQGTDGARLGIRDEARG